MVKRCQTEKIKGDMSASRAKTLEEQNVEAVVTHLQTVPIQNDSDYSSIQFSDQSSHFESSSENEEESKSLEKALDTSNDKKDEAEEGKTPKPVASEKSLTPFSEFNSPKGESPPALGFAKLNQSEPSPDHTAFSSPDLAAKFGLKGDEPLSKTAPKNKQQKQMLTRNISYEIENPFQFKGSALLNHKSDLLNFEETSIPSKGSVNKKHRNSIALTRPQRRNSFQSSEMKSDSVDRRPQRKKSFKDKQKSFDHAAKL